VSYARESGYPQLYQLFADILEYPTPDLCERAREGATLLLPLNSEAAGHVEAFAAWVEETPPGRLEEVYTGTFDLQVVCYPYVGYHLFGESYNAAPFCEVERGVSLSRFLGRERAARSFGCGLALSGRAAERGFGA